VTETSGGHQRSPLARISVFAGILFVIAGLTGLGVWQLQRRVWKLGLIARVDARVHAAPVAPPPPADWSKVSAERDEYLRIRVAGYFLNGHETDVQALTALGPGFWVLTPLKTDQGFVVLVNRGFVPPEHRALGAHSLVPGEATVTGLLRITEPHGRFLRANAPAQDRWYSRDVAAIAITRDLTGPIAPYFIDAEAGADPDAWPRGGLTVIDFPNNHLLYALTWFSLALMLAGATLYNVRRRN
jgi:surfeit locus 1 family protein